MQQQINEWLSTLSSTISANLWLAPLLALLAGVLTSLTPCSLSSVPLVIGFVGGTGQRDTKKAFLLSATFAAGMAVSFTSLGVAARFWGRFFTGKGSGGTLFWAF